MKLRKRYPELLGLSSCKLDIRPTVPLELSQVFLLAKDSASYTFASHEEENLQSLLAKDGRILRQNETIEFVIPEDTHPLQNGLPNGHTDGQNSASKRAISYQVTLLEPVLQGYIPGMTTSEIIVLPPLESDSEKQKQSSRIVSKGSTDWHVDEDFLARGGGGAGVLDSTFEGDASLSITSQSFLPGHLTSEMGVTGSSSSTWQSPLSSPRSIKSAQLDTSILSDYNTSSRGIHNNKGRLLRVMACKRYIEDDDLTPLPDIDEDEHTRVFVRASDLTKLGLFSGDRVEIQGLSSESRRIVRVYGLRRQPSLPDRWVVRSHTAHSVFIPS